ncbi:MAG: PsbP-related protein [Patescibacteria group bacterium]
MAQGERHVRHRHQWAWISAGIVIISIGTVWYVTGQRSDSSPQDTNQNSMHQDSLANATTDNTNIGGQDGGTNTNVGPAVQKYTNTEYTFSVEYPTGWDKVTSITGAGANKIFSIQLSDPVSPSINVSISVMAESFESQVRDSISISSEQSITVNGQSGQELTGGSAKDGSTVTIVMMIKDGLLYSVRGTGQEFENIVNSLELN